MSTEQARAVVLVVGAGPQAAALALCLAAGGAAVRLHAPDEDDARRLRDGLRRLGEYAEARSGLTFSAGPLAGDGTEFELAIVAAEALDPADAEPLIPASAPLAVLAGDPVAAAARLRHPERLVGLNPTGPAGRGALMEVTGAASDAAARLTARLQSAGFAVLAAQDRGAGTLAQRLALRLGDAIEVLLLSGLAPSELDAAFCCRGCVRGPLEGQDLVGLDSAFALRRRRASRLGASKAPVPSTPAQDRMVAEGRLGKAAGVGWYRYPGGGGAVIDPLIEDLIAEEAHFARHRRPSVVPAAAAEMTLAALLHEGALALEDGTAANTGALDLTARHLLALPARSPGLRAQGVAIGAPGLAARLAELDALGGGLMPPAGDFRPALVALLDLASVKRVPKPR